MIHDKAEWHLSNDYPEYVPHENAYIFGGFFFGWLIENRLVRDDFVQEDWESISSFLARQITASQFYQRQDGVLDDDILAESGQAFAKHYFPDTYLEDFIDKLSIENTKESLYTVAGSWSNYQIISDTISKAYQDWQLLMGGAKR